MDDESWRQDMMILGAPCFPALPVMRRQEGVLS